MNKRTERQMEATDGKSQEEINPTENDKTASPAVIPNEGENRQIDKIIEWANKCGVTDTDLKGMLATQILTSCASSTEDLELFQDGILAMHKGIEPKDTIESLLAAQMVAVHNMAMKFTRQAMLSSQTPDGVNANVNNVARLMRTFTSQMEALNRHRGKGQQKISVEHVHVNEGGKAIVGNITGGVVGDGE